MNISCVTSTYTLDVHIALASISLEAETVSSIIHIWLQVQLDIHPPHGFTMAKFSMGILTMALLTVSILTMALLTVVGGTARQPPAPPPTTRQLHHPLSITPGTARQPPARQVGQPAR